MAKTIRGIVSTLLLIVVIHLGGSNSQFAPVFPRPLCLSQFTLVNHACQNLPYAPLPPPSPQPPPNSFSPAPSPSPEPLFTTDLVYVETPAEDECCRWMRAVDSECVCSLLARLPTFLSRPLHQYTTVAHAACSVTFTCSSA
ncbi:unnamed protein product [Withania somnifera]